MQKKVIGALIKSERLKQQRKQSELAHGICVASYLSKIEQGQVQAEEEIIRRLFERLGIQYHHDNEVTTQAQQQIDDYFYCLHYYFDRTNAVTWLQTNDSIIQYSAIAIDWLIINVMEESRSWDVLTPLVETMTIRQKAYYTIIKQWQNQINEGQEDEFIQACESLKNSFGLSQLCWFYYRWGKYTEIHRLESRMVALAIEEGNTYRLAEYYTMKGNAYASVNQSKLMMVYYERSINMLKNTRWSDELDHIYYNAGATCVNFKDYKQALNYLDLVQSKQQELRVAIYHKKALIYIRQNQLKKGEEYLIKMEEALHEQDNTLDSEWLKLEEAHFECKENFVDDPRFLALIDKMVVQLKQDYHFGHLYFYKDIIIQTYKHHRMYKKALEFEEEISYKLAENIS